MKNHQAVRPGTSGLFYEVADRAVDAIIPRVIEMGELLDEAEDAIINGADARDAHRRVLARRNLAGSLRRMLAPRVFPDLLEHEVDPQECIRLCRCTGGREKRGWLPRLVSNQQPYG